MAYTENLISQINRILMVLLHKRASIFLQYTNASLVEHFIISDFVLERSFYTVYQPIESLKTALNVAC